MSFNLKTISVLALASSVNAYAYAEADATPAVICNDNTVPKQLRVAYAGPGAMAVSWNTDQKLSNPFVDFGKEDKLDNTASSSISTTYATSSTYNNHVTLTKLQADTVYQYRPQCGSTTHTFRTARDAGRGDKFSFAMIGDMGAFGPDGLSTAGPASVNPLLLGDHTTIQSLSSLKSTFDFVWHVGDIAYADAWAKEEKAGVITPLAVNAVAGAPVYDRILNEFYDQIETLSSDMPYMVGPGNHEANCDNGADFTLCLPGQLNFTGFRQHWNMPSPSSGGLENFWYSFDHGMAHFIMINTETDFPNAPDEPGGSGVENAGPFAPSGAQLAWLEKDLASVDRKKTPWVIVSGHRPWYVSTTICPECKAAFEPLFIKYDVDLVMHGHKHFYERHAAVANGVVTEIDNNPVGPWYIVNGAAGHWNGLDAVGPLVPSSRKTLVEYGWNRFTVQNCTHLTTEFISSAQGVVKDTATLIKHRKCSVSGGDGGDK